MAARKGLMAIMLLPCLLVASAFSPCAKLPSPSLSVSVNAKGMSAMGGERRWSAQHRQREERRSRGGVLDSRAQLFGFLGGGGPRKPDVRELKSQLMAACKQTQRGVEGGRDEVEAIVSQLEASSPTKEPSLSPILGGDWDLAWTSEKEVAFLMEKGLFGDKCVRVFQNIDTAAPSLSNTVLFDNGSFLKVQSTFQAGVGGPNSAEGGGDFFSFEFKSASIRWRNFELPIPPVGKGWSKQVYLDKDLRIQTDSRGDLAIYSKKL